MRRDLEELGAEWRLSNPLEEEKRETCYRRCTTRPDQLTTTPTLQAGLPRWEIMMMENEGLRMVRKRQRIRRRRKLRRRGLRMRGKLTDDGKKTEGEITIFLPVSIPLLALIYREIRLKQPPTPTNVMANYVLTSHNAFLLRCTQSTVSW